MRLRYRLVPGDSAQNLRDAARLTQKDLAAAIDKVVTIGANFIAADNPVHTGASRAGWDSEVTMVGTSKVRGAITNAQRHIEFVNDGRRPGRPPPTAVLVPWVGQKLGIPVGPERVRVAFLVARAIGRRGLTGAHMIESGWGKARPHMDRELHKVGLQFQRRAES